MAKIKKAAAGAAAGAAVGGPLGAVIGGGLGLLGGALQNRYQRQAADLSYRRNLEMWNMQNEYNHPSQQIARMREAGLNPALMYGTGSAGGGTADQARGYDTPSMVNPVQNVPAMLNMFNDMKVKNAQANNLDQQAKLNTTRAVLDIARKPGVMADSTRKQIESNIAKATQNYSIDAARESYYKLAGEANIAQQRSESEYYNAKIRKIEADWLEKYGISKSDFFLIRQLITTGENFMNWRSK